MRNGISALVACVILGGVQPALARSDRSKVVQKALRQSVRVEVEAGGKVVRSASGVVVASEGHTSYVLTNAHVVQRAGLHSDPEFTVVIERPRLHRLRARLVREGKAPDRDLALLAVEGDLIVAAPVATADEVGVGDDVVVIGAPYGKALSVSSGIVSQLEIDESSGKPVQTAMKTDAPIGYGASGGGVFEVPGGKLVGLVEGYRTARVAFGGSASDDYSFDIPMPGETFVAPPSKIRAFLLDAGVGKLAGIESPVQEMSQAIDRHPSPRRAPPLRSTIRNASQARPDRG